jgi:hypothetical protein
MVETTVRLSAREQVEQARQARDEARGYRINMKYLGIAFVSEGIVIILGLIAAVLFAIEYGKGNQVSMAFMILAPIGYAVVEMARVPLALLMRTQPSFLIKIACFLGVLAAAVVTTKTLSQLGEIMFRPRMIEVTEARHNYHEAVARRDAFQGEYAARKAVLDQASATLTSANETSVKQVEALQTTAQPQRCPNMVKGRNGRLVQNGTKPCPESAASKAIRTTMTDQQGTVTAARTQVDEANKSLRALGTAEEVEATVVQTKKVYDNAILHSQLHSFTGMFFAKDPAQVTEGELSNFLRLFVFLPAICASLASTLLAMGSVTRIKPKRIKAAASQKVVPVGGGRYVLEPLHKTVVEKAIDTVIDGVKKSETSPQATPSLKVA